MPLAAQISTYQHARDERSAARKLLRLQVAVAASADSLESLVHNISERGLLLQTSADLRTGETLAVELPAAGKIDAVIVWARDGYFGCEFREPVSKAVVSAALLRSPAELPELTVGPIVPMLDGHRSLWDDRASWIASSTEPEKAPVNGALLLFSLFLALLTASLFVWTVLTLPFSTT